MHYTKTKETMNSKPFSKNTFFSLLSLLCCFLLLSCSSSCPIPNSPQELAQPFELEFYDSKEPPKHYNVFIDASFSMFGFMGENSEFLNLVNSMMTRMNVPDDNINFYSFGQGSAKLEGSLKTNLHKISTPKFYSEGRTDITKPLELLQQDLHSVNIILTDGVQSTTHAQQDYALFARNLKEHVGHSGFFAMLGKRLAFSGKYYCEKSKGSLTLPQGSTRPVYCLAFGKREYGKYFMDNFSRDFEHSFEFGLPSTDNKLGFTSKFSNPADLKILNHLGDRPHLCLSYFKLRSKDFHKTNKELIKIHLKNYEEIYGSTVDYSIAYKGKKDSVYVDIKEAGGHTEARIVEDGTIGIEIPFKQRYNGCYLVLLTFRKTLPYWIRDWNTDDDTKIENSSQTYGLKPWMEFIMNAFEQYKYLSTTSYYLHIAKE